MKIKVLVNGAKGKMGSMLCSTLRNSAGFELAGLSDSKAELQKHLDNAYKNIDIVVDLTSAVCVYENSLAIIQSNIKPVIGTSGLTPKQIKELQIICQQKKLGGIIAPNFSIGAMLMMQCAKLLAKNFAKTEIIEYHHDKKFDKPSGTAKQTAQIIDSARENNKNPLTGKAFNKNSGTPIHSIRLPGLLAHQNIIFGSTGETISIKHDSISRECFMLGILFACQKAIILDNLVYGLENLL